MREMITVREWIKRFENGDYRKADFDTQVAAGWYDCFCEESELPSRLKMMGEIITQITNEYLLDNFWIWFKNNCPAVGPLYDDMRFEPMDETKRDEMYFLVTLNDKRADNTYEVITARDKYRCEYSCEETSDLVQYINGIGAQFSAKAA
jgi:hypothetical protein